MTPSNKEKAKTAAAKAAASLIQNGMTIGLGSGSTTALFIQFLNERCLKEKLDIKAIATSHLSATLASAIPLVDINTIVSLDLCVDGADEIDHQKRMIKGGGGALLREKIAASMSKEMIVIVDNEKVVDQLGAFPLPVEISTFAYSATLAKMRSLGYDAHLRITSTKKPYITDNGNFIIDISFPNKCPTPEKDNAILKNIPGVLETGFFFNLAGRVIVGYPDGTTDFNH